MEYRDCVCVLVGGKYGWEYVERLYSMLERHSSIPVRLHVLTEPGRRVPDPFVRHELQIMPELSGADVFWWYKMQLFDRARFVSPMMYFDLDMVIVGNVDFLWQGDPRFFWAVRDFRYLWRPGCFDINSSIMHWDPEKFSWIWEDFCRDNICNVLKAHPGDQDYLTAAIPRDRVRFFDTDLVKSWRWQIQDGGWDFRKKKSLTPGHTTIDQITKIIVFHGRPKPHEIQNPVLRSRWILS
jgi:hypothetical protein